MLRLGCRGICPEMGGGIILNYKESCSRQIEEEIVQLMEFHKRSKFRAVEQGHSCISNNQQCHFRLTLYMKFRIFGDIVPQRTFQLQKAILYEALLVGGSVRWSGVSQKTRNQVHSRKFKEICLFATIGRVMALLNSLNVSTFPMILCCFLSISAIQKTLYGRTDQPTNGQTLIQRSVDERREVCFFLDASTHLYMRVCPSVRRSVGRSVGPSRVFF